MSGKGPTSAKGLSLSLRFLTLNDAPDLGQCSGSVQPNHRGMSALAYVSESTTRWGLLIAIFRVGHLAPGSGSGEVIIT